MTKYLDKIVRGTDAGDLYYADPRVRELVRDLVTWPPEGWYDPDSSPLDDYRKAVRQIEEDDGYVRPK